MSPLLRDDEMRGVNEPIAFDAETFAPTWSLEGRMYPDFLAFLFNGIAAPVTTAGDGSSVTDLEGVAVPIGAYRHDWTPPYQSGSLPVTLAFRACYKEESQFYDVRGATVDSIELATADTGGCTVKATGTANSITPISDPSLTPTYESLAIGPFLKSYASIVTDLASAAKAENVTLNFTSPTEHIRTMSGASKYPDTTQYTATGVPTWSGSINRLRMATADYAALLAATRFTMLVKFLHTSIIASAYPYKVYVSGPSSAAYTGGKFDPLINARRTGGTYDFKFSRLAAASSKFQVVNATAAY